jgi:cytochrome c553
MLPGRQQPSNYLNDDLYAAVILEETGKLYNKLTTKLTDDVMAAAADTRSSSLPSIGNNNQKIIHNIDNTHQ